MCGRIRSRVLEASSIRTRVNVFALIVRKVLSQKFVVFVFLCLLFVKKRKLQIAFNVFTLQELIILFRAENTIGGNGLGFEV